MANEPQPNGQAAPVAQNGPLDLTNVQNMATSPQQSFSTGQGANILVVPGLEDDGTGRSIIPPPPPVNQQPPVQPPVAQPVQTQPPVQQPAIPGVFGEPAQPPVQPVQPPVQQVAPTQYSPLEVQLATQLREAQLQIDSMKQMYADPLKAIAENAPGLVIEHFKPEVYVKQKLDAKFGEDFIPDANKAMIPGTPDEQYARMKDALYTEAAGIMTNAQNNSQQVSPEQQQQFNTMVDTIAQKYGIDRTYFDENIWKPLEQMPQSEILDIIVQNHLLRRQSQNIQNGIQNQQLVTPVPSAVDIMGSNGVQTPVNPAQDEIGRMFGKKAAERVAYIPFNS